MAEVITFTNFRPPARFDHLPWTGSRIEESADGLDPWTQIDMIPFDQVDLDPADPALRSFTTENGTALGYWYRILFEDATGDTSQPTVPIQNAGAAAGAPAVTAYATVDELFRILKVRSPTTAQREAGQRVLDAAALEIDREIGRSEPYTEPPALVVEVNLERAVEHWRAEEAPFGVIGFDSSLPTPTAQNSWDRYAFKLAYLKESWGLA